MFKGGLQTVNREFGCKSRRAHSGRRSDRKNHKMKESGKECREHGVSECLDPARNHLRHRCLGPSDTFIWGVSRHL